MLKIFFIIIIFTVPLLSDDQPIHSIRFKGMGGIGSLRLAEKQETDQTTRLETAYTNLKDPTFIFPYSITEFANGRTYSVFQQFGLEYRYNDNLRISVDRRDMNGKAETRTTHIPIPGYFFDPSSDLYSWRETRYRIGGEYLFPITDFLKLGPMLKLYQMNQSYNNNTFDYTDIYYTPPGSSTIKFSSSTRGQEKMFAKYTGLVPGMNLEFIFSNWFRIGITYEMLNLHGKKEVSEIYTGSVVRSGTNSSITTIGRYSDSGIMELKGSIGDLSFQFRPFKYFGITLGVRRESYRRTYKTFTFADTTTPSVTDVYVQEVIQKSVNAKFLNQVTYLQAELMVDF